MIYTKSMIYIGADHRGYKHKEVLKKYLDALGYKYKDVGALEYDEDDDYPDFAKPVAEKVAEDPESNRGILLCGSGVGVDITANRFKGVRSALVSTVDLAAHARRNDNCNVLSLAADILEEKKMKKMVKTFLETEFSGEKKYVRRLNKIDD